MSASTTTFRRLPAPIALVPAWHHRLLDRAEAALQRFVAWRRQRREQAAARQQAALHRALVEQLDAATLRDLGLGDWVAARGAGRWIDVDRF